MSRTEIPIPNNKQRTVISGSDHDKLKYIAMHYNIRQTEAVRMLIRKEYKDLISNNK